MAQYRKKPVVIEAVRWRGYNSNLGVTAEPPDQPVEITAENMHGIKWEPLPDWLPPVSHIVSDGGSPPQANPNAGEVWRNGDELWLGTLEGTMICTKDDWIIRGVKGEIYPCKPDIFASTYETVV